ncbi:hypothetical protein IAT38_008114 [Cryptococcus sp. DSM 104549]
MQQEGTQQQPNKKVVYKSAAHQFFATLPSANNASSSRSSRVDTSAHASSSRQKLPPPSSSSSRHPGASSSSSSSSFSSKAKGKGKAKAPVRVIDLTEDDDLPPQPRKKPTKPVKRAIIDLTLSSEDEKEKDPVANASSDSDSDIEIVSSTMASRKSKDLQRERARDKANGLVQARFSFSKDENVMRYATVSPTKKSLPSSPALPLGSSPIHSGRTIQVKRKTSAPKVSGAVASGGARDGSSSAKDKGEISSSPPAPVRRTVTPTSAFASLFAPSKSSPSHPLSSSPTVAMRGKVEHQSPRFSASPTTIRSPSGLSTTPSHKHGESATPSQGAAPPTPTTSSATMPVFPLPRHESNPFDVRGSPAAKPPSSLSLPRVKANVFGGEDEDDAYKPPSNSREKPAPSATRSGGRARPLPGAYALPAVDTPIHDWPTFQGSSGSTRRRAEKGKGKAAAAEGSVKATVSVDASVKDKPQAEVIVPAAVAAASPARSKSVTSQPLLSTPSSSPIKASQRRLDERKKTASPTKSPVKRSPVKSKSTTSVSTSQMLSPPSSSPGPSVSQFLAQLVGRDASEEAEPAPAEPVPAQVDAEKKEEEEEKEQEEVPMAIDELFAPEEEAVAPEVEEAEALTSPEPEPAHEGFTEESTPTLTSDLELGPPPVIPYLASASREATPHPAPALATREATPYPAPSTPKPLITVDLAPDSPITPLPLPSESDLTSLSGRSMRSTRSSLRPSTRGLSILSTASTLTQLSATPTKSVYKASISRKGKASYKRGPKLSPSLSEMGRRQQMQVVVEIPAWRDEVRREYTPLVLSPTKGKKKGKGKGKGKGRLVERKEVQAEAEPAPEQQMEETEKEEEAKPEEDTWEEMDLDAWDDFDWAAPAPTADGPSMSTPTKRTPSKRALSRPATPSQAGLMTPSRRLLAAASASGSVSGTARTGSKRALSASPSASAKKRKMQKPVFDEYQRLFEEEKQKRAKAEEEAAEERAIQRRKEAEEEAAQAEMMASDDDEEEEADPLASILANIKSPVKPNAGLRVSSRNASLQDARKAKQEEKRETERQRQAKLSEARKNALEEKRKAAALREFDALGKEMQQSDTARELLRDLDGEDDAEDERPYPTPAESESIAGDGMSDYGEEVDEAGGVKREREDSVGEIVDTLKANDIEIDESLVRDARMAKEKPTDVFTWEGFWEKDFAEVKAEWMADDEMPVLQAETDDPIVSLLKTYTAAGDTAALSALVSSGVLSLVDSSFDGAISSWLYDYALASPDAQWAEVATTALVHIFETGKVPLTAVSLNQQIPSVLLYIGARPSIFSGFEGVDIKIPQLQNREMACILLCRILKAGLKYHHDDSPVSHLLVPILLLLAIDPATSKTLRRHIDEAITLLLALDVKPDSPMAARAVAAKIAERTTPYSEDVWSAILAVLGETTQPARDVNRWLGMAYFRGGSLSNLDNLTNPPPVPSVPLVVTRLSPVFNSLKEPPAGREPDWKHFNNVVTFLSSAISDIDMLVKLDLSLVSKDKSGDQLVEEHPVQDIRFLIGQMKNHISDQSDGTHKSLVKGRLHQLLEITRLVLKLSIRKHKYKIKLGKNLEHGTGGQTRLSFGAKREGEAEAPVEQAGPSSDVAMVEAQEVVAGEVSSDVDVNELV